MTEPTDGPFIAWPILTAIAFGAVLWVGVMW
jgi:hypothetical protein